MNKQPESYSKHDEQDHAAREHTEQSPVILITRSTDETARFAAAIAAWTRNGDVIALQGEIGTGKTVIAKAMAVTLGIGETVTSPTFGLIMEYQRGRKNKFYHLDLYRLQSPEQALAAGVEEYLFTDEAITVVEWPEHIVNILKNACGKDENRLLYIRLYHEKGDCRKIILPRKPGEEILNIINR